MTLLRFCKVALGFTLLFPAKGASESGSSVFPAAAIPTLASTTAVLSIQPTISSMRAAAYASFTAGTASANDLSPPLDPPLRLAGKRRNSVAEFFKSFRKNSKDNLKRVFRTLINPRPTIRRSALHVSLFDRQLLHDLLNIRVINPILDTLISYYKIAYGSLSALSRKLQRTSQTWATASENWANRQVASSTQWMQEWISDPRSWVYGGKWSSAGVTIWRPNEGGETWWPWCYPTATSAHISTSPLSLLQRLWCLFTWAYQITTLALYLLLAFLGVAFALAVLCLALGALVLLKLGYRRIRVLWDALLNE